MISNTAQYFLLLVYSSEFDEMWYDQRNNHQVFLSKTEVFRVVFFLLFFLLYVAFMLPCFVACTTVITGSN